MREIKFRAWDRHEKRMIEADELVFWNGCCYRNPTKSLNDPNKPHVPARLKGYSILEEYIMQYTGLKDKNGTEIYEGDIVKFNDFWSEITGGNVGDTIRTCFVEYITSGFFLRDVLDEEYEEDLGMALINDDEFEVIGNVYQNGGLLNDS